MKKLYAVLLVGSLATPIACKDFLDVNTNPNAPEQVSANVLLPPLLYWMATAPQFDNRFIGRYTQNWTLPSTAGLSTWDRMGYDPGSDNGGTIWRAVYWSLGQNLVDMNTKAEAEQRWDLLGVGQVIKAWGWQMATDVYGEIIVKEAIDQSKFSFNYDTQDYAYLEVQKLLNSAITNLQRSDGAVSQSYLAKGDKIYGGDRAKWLKLAYGLLAINLNHLSNRPGFKAADVIAAVDKSLASNADDPLMNYPGTSSDDLSFFGRGFGNGSFFNYRQTQYVVSLMNGTQFGGTVDPRLTRVLSPSPDGVVRGLDINVVNGGAFSAPQAPNNFYGYVGTAGSQLPGRYIFDDKAKLPVLTYAELQFIKAEAAYKSGDKATALDAYTKGISASIDYVNSRNAEISSPAGQIPAAEKAAFLASPAIVPTAATLTLSQIMTQKYIALFGWGNVETWVDMRRYHYTDIDPASAKQVFLGFTPPTTLYPDNAGKLVQRIRPRYNSEYVWNIPALTAIGGLKLDYHTVPLWITQ